MTILSTLATISGTVMALANIPQAYKIFKRKSAKDLSIIPWALSIIVGTIWLFYGLEINSFPVVIQNSIALVVVTIVIIGWFLYGR